MQRPTFGLLLAALTACGGAPPPPAESPRLGQYNGPNELDFVVTAPIQRQMPHERHRGSAVVTDDTGAQVTLELRMLESGDVCRIVAQRGAPASAADAPETLTVGAGQRCSSRFVYEGSPVAAIVQINEGTVTLGPGTIAVRLTGPFVANMAGADGPTELEGVARWQLDGRR